MSNQADETIWVKYSVVDGAHFFTGTEGYALGLCVAHKDLETAFNEVSTQLQNLILANHGVEHVIVEPGISYLELANYSAAKPANVKSEPEIPFEVEREAA